MWIFLFCLCLICQKANKNKSKTCQGSSPSRGGLPRFCSTKSVFTDHVSVLHLITVSLFPSEQVFTRSKKSSLSSDLNPRASSFTHPSALPLQDLTGLKSMFLCGHQEHLLFFVPFMTFCCCYF